MKKTALKAVEAARTQGAQTAEKAREVQGQVKTKIKDDDEARLVSEILGVVSTARKELDEQRLATTKPLRDEKDEIDKAFKEIEGPVKGMELALKDLIADWDEREEKRIEAENKRREDEAAEAQAAEDQQAADEGRESAILEEPKLEKKEPVRNLAGGTSGSRIEYDIEVTEPDKVPREWCKPDEVAMRSFVKLKKGKVEIPGVRIIRKRTVSHRRS